MCSLTNLFMPTEPTEVTGSTRSTEDERWTHEGRATDTTGNTDTEMRFVHGFCAGRTPAFGRRDGSREVGRIAEHCSEIQSVLRSARPHDCHPRAKRGATSLTLAIGARSLRCVTVRLRFFVLNPLPSSAPGVFTHRCDSPENRASGWDCSTGRGRSPRPIVGASRRVAHVVLARAEAGGLVMIELRPRREDDAVAGPPQPQAVVDVVEVDREASRRTARPRRRPRAASSGRRR